MPKEALTFMEIAERWKEAKACMSSDTESEDEEETLAKKRRPQVSGLALLL